MSRGIYRHDPEFRARMRGLLQGFLEHCEISPSLVGRIEQFVHFEGRKYGVPVFTVFGPPHPGLGTELVGLIGVNTGQDAVTADTLLQLIERLALQPHIASGHILRIVPVSDPVCLESGNHSFPKPSSEFRLPGKAVDGVIEIRLTDEAAFQISAEGPSEVLQAVLAGEDALARLGSEEAGGEVVAEGSLVQHPGNWRVVLGLPRSWPASIAVHWASQLLVVFFRTRVALLTAAGRARCAWADSASWRLSRPARAGSHAESIEPSTVL